MAIAVRQIDPSAPFPWVLGGLRRLEVATVLARLLPSPPAPVLSCGRGGAAVVLAMLDGPHALQKVGPRLAERGRLALLQPGLTRASLQEARVGHLREARLAADRNQGFRALALKALAVSALPTPWLQQDPTPIALYGVQADEPQRARAPRPAYGPSHAGRDDRHQVLLSLGVRGDGGRPLRGGVRDGHRRDRVETPGAMAAWLALGREGGPGSGADRQASRRRTWGVCLERQSGRGPVGPRPCAIRPALAPWGRQPPAWPLWVAKPGRTQDEAPRCWPGQSLRRPVAVEDSDGRSALEALRLVSVQASPRAPQPTSTSAAAQAQGAPAGADHRQRVQARWLVCRPDAEAALAEYEGRGRRGRRRRPWRSPTGGSPVVADTRRSRHPRRGRPANTAPPAPEGGYRVGVEVEALAHPEEDQGWTGLATTVSPAGSPDAALLQAYQEQHTPGEPGVRGSKQPAAMAPVGLEQPARRAAWAMLTVVGLLVYRLIQRQVRLALRTPEQQLPGTKGLTAIPTAAVGLTLLSQVALVQ